MNGLLTCEAIFQMNMIEILKRNKILHAEIMGKSKRRRGGQEMSGK